MLHISAKIFLHIKKKKKRKERVMKISVFVKRTHCAQGKMYWQWIFFPLNLSSTSQNPISSMAFIQLLLSLSLIVSLCTRVKTILLHPSTVC